MVPVLIPGEQLYSTITWCGPLPDTFVSICLDTAQLPAAGAAVLPALWAARSSPPPTVMPSLPARIHLESLVIFMFAPRSMSRSFVRQATAWSTHCANASGQNEPPLQPCHGNLAKWNAIVLTVGAAMAD
jgi:hypothetical protein